MNAERDFGLASVGFGIALGYNRAAASNTFGCSPSVACAVAKLSGVKRHQCAILARRMPRDTAP